MALRTNRLTRQQIAQFIGTDRGVRAFEDVQGDVTDQFEQLSGASFMTLGSEPILGSERVFTPVPGELAAEDHGANGLYELGLADTGTPGTYGDDSSFPVITTDRKGRVIAVSTRPAASGGSSSLGGTSTVTVPNGRIEWSETVTATGVTGASRIIASLAPATDADENDPEMLGLGALAGLPGTDQITFTLAFAEPVAGAVKINWSAL